MYGTECDFYSIIKASVSQIMGLSLTANVVLIPLNSQI